MVGGVSTYWFTVESIGGIENAALSFIPEEYLSPMPEGATIAMLRRLGRVAGCGSRMRRPSLLRDPPETCPIGRANAAPISIDRLQLARDHVPLMPGVRRR